MRRVTIAVMSTIAAVVLLFSYRTSRAPADAAAAPPRGTPEPTATGQPPTPSGGVTVTGSTVQTTEGPVQVQVRIFAGKLVEVTALHWPTGDLTHDEIQAAALPKLHASALAAQSSRIDGVSGATATSGGYRQSLQSALDKAHFE
jgi:uncharacterized protein with FMN-binding domain